VDFSTEKLFVKVSWFEPLLNQSSVVENYEVQICCLKGPLVKIINESKSGDGILNEFETIRNDLEVNYLEINNLKAGSKYQCRVRFKIKNELDWCDWDKAILSDIFSMPASPPDPPFNVEALVNEDYFASEKMIESSDKNTLEHKNDRYVINDNSIVITW
jgi:hypothetical protein